MAGPTTTAGPAESVDAGFWQLSRDVALASLQTGADGLSPEIARRRLAQYGPNDATHVRRRPAWLQLLGRFTNPLIAILLIASALSAAMGDVASFLIVLAIVVLSVVLDFIQEMRAQATIDALRASVALEAT